MTVVASSSVERIVDQNWVLSSHGRRVRLKIFCEIVIYCDYEWLYKEWSINPITSPNPVLLLTPIHVTITSSDSMQWQSRKPTAENSITGLKKILWHVGPLLSNDSVKNRPLLHNRFQTCTNGLTGKQCSLRSPVRHLRDAQTEELLEEVFSMCSMPRCYK
jgi:hypothetical protein